MSGDSQRSWQRFGFAVDRELIDRARAAAAATGVPMAQLVNRALASELNQLEAANGGRFPAPTAPLPRGFATKPYRREKREASMT